MADNSSIEWTDATWNPVRARLREDVRYEINSGFKILPAGTWGYHCERISPGCKRCYACTMNGRTLPAWGTGLDYTVLSRDKVEIYLDEQELLKPLSWRKPRRVFPCSMTDLFADFVPDEMIDRVFAVMALAPQHTFQVLTKRADRMEQWLTNDGIEDDESMRDRMDKAACELGVGACHANMNPQERWPLPNVWLGVSVENQEYADKRIPALLRTPAAVRFLSVEPMLGPVDLVKLHSLDYHKNTIGYETYPLAGLQAVPDCDWEHGKLDWVIVGGESGPGARPCDVAWIRDIVRQCRDAAVPCFVKQLGANVAGNASEFHGTVVTHKGHSRPHLYDRKGGDIKEWPEDLRVREMPAVRA